MITNVLELRDYIQKNERSLIMSKPLTPEQRHRLISNHPLPSLPSPTVVEIGQIWRYRGMEGRALVVVDFVRQHGCCPSCVDNPDELWAVFRRGKKCVVHHMLDPRSTWTFHGYAF